MVEWVLLCSMAKVVFIFDGCFWLTDCKIASEQAADGRRGAWGGASKMHL